MKRYGLKPKPPASGFKPPAAHLTDIAVPVRRQIWLSA